jgi:hypothetical protein
VIYLDSSVALAHLLVEERRPPGPLWANMLISSRRLEYEIWCRLHAHGLGASHGEPARQLLNRVSFVELSPLFSNERWSRFRRLCARSMPCIWHPWSPCAAGASIFAWRPTTGA